ncbi:MAG: flagellar basal body rod protein FlgB [Ignavibacteriaceae bacterium]
MSTIKLLENLIDYCAVKNNVVSKNLANIGTENYQRKEVVFKDVLTSQLNPNLKTTEARHISPGNIPVEPDFNVVEDSSIDMVSGINNVDIEKEMAELAENTIHFKFAANKIGSYYKTLQKVIRGE